MNSIQVYNRISKLIWIWRLFVLLSSFLSHFGCPAQIIVTYKHICYLDAWCKMPHAHINTHPHTHNSPPALRVPQSAFILLFLIKDCWSIKAPLIIGNSKKETISIKCYRIGGFRCLLWQQSIINVYKALRYISRFELNLIFFFFFFSVVCFKGQLHKASWTQFQNRFRVDKTKPYKSNLV